MKKTRISLISILLLAASVLMFLLVFNFSSLSAVALGEGDFKADYLLFDGEKIYLGEDEAGTTSGIGKFKLDARDVTLTANANDGFKILGWQVTYNDQSEGDGFKTEFIKYDSENEISTNLISKSGLNIPVSINFIDEDGNGDFEKSEFVISHVFENLTVDPIYDYVYYNLDITDIINLTNILNESFYHVDDLTFAKVYYADKTTADRTTYTNAILSVGEKYYYFGNLIFDEDSLFTEHDYAGSAIKVDYTLGGFRLGENVNADFNMNIVGDINSDINIIVDRASIFANGEKVDLSSEGEQNTFAITTDENTPRTTSVNINFEIQNDTNRINTLAFDYTTLFVADINIYLDESLAEDADFDLAMSSIKVLNADFTFVEDEKPTGKYFVKSTNNEFKISCGEKISKIVDARLFDYYNFASIDDSLDKDKSYNNITKNFAIKINYTSIEYYIDFEFAVFDNEKIVSVVGDFNLPNRVALTRGNSATFEVMKMPQNFGYTFYGFLRKNSLTSEIETGNLSVTMDSDKPENKTYLLLYTIRTYDLKIGGLYEAKLQNEGDIYGFSSLRVLINNNAATALSSDKLIPTETNEILLSSAIKIGDTIVIEYTLNNGFKLEKYEIFDDEIQFADSLNFVLTKEILETALNKNTNTIDVNLLVDYVLYEFNFVINASSTDTGSEIMATTTVDVSLSHANQESDVSDIYYKDGEVVLDSAGADSHVINVKNLRLYDKVKLSATSISDEYIFNRFTENDWTSLDYTLDGNTYSHTATIVRDNMQIKVVYSMQTSLLVISTNLDAYTFFADGNPTLTLSTTSMIEGYEPTLKEDYTVDVQAGDLTVTLDPAFIKFGYDLDSYIFTFVSDSPITIENYTFTINIPSTDNVKYLKLNFKEVKYALNVAQVGADVENENFELSLSISQPIIRFTMPTGYYVASVYFDDDLISDLAQTNDYPTSEYSRVMTPEEMENWFNEYGVKADDKVTINMRVEYALHTYSITINFEIANPKGSLYDEYFTLPNMEASANEQTLTPIQFGRSLRFDDIPYGANVVVRILNELPFGFSVEQGWLVAGRVPYYEHTSSEITISNLIYNEVLSYRVMFTEYNLNLLYDLQQGNPLVYVNSGISNTATMFDSITIVANAFRSSGYRFKEIYYFDSMDNRISILQDRFTLDSFSPSEFKLEGEKGDTINIYIEYETIEITLLNKGSADKTLTYKSEVIDPTNFADYEVYLVDNSGTHIGEKLENVTLNMSQNIRIVVRLKNLDDYRLAQGIELKSVNIANVRGVGFNLISDGVFETNIIRLAEMMSLLSEDENATLLQINYAYSISNKQIRLTTNISDESFYHDEGSLINKFEMTFEGEGASYVHSSYIDATLTYLASSRFICGFNNPDYSEYFTIYTIKVYLATNLNDPIPESRYSYYGITVDKSEIVENPDTDRSVSRITINTMFVDNLVIVVQVMPKLKLNGAPFVDDAYTFTKTFRCDEFGNGIPRTLTIGASGTNADITMDRILLESLIVGDDGGEPIYNIHYAGGHTNVGRYPVSLEFNTTGKFAWLKDIVLPYRIILQIDPLNIRIEARDLGELNAKVYDGKSDYNVSNVLSCLYFVGGENLNVQVNSVDCQLSLLKDREVLKAIIQGVNANADGEGNLFGAKYDILISLLTLDPSNSYPNNRNFVLTNDSVTILNCMTIKRKSVLLYNLKAQDKLFDNNTTATVDTTNVRLSDDVNEQLGVAKSKLNFVFESANIGLNKQIRLTDADILIGPAEIVMNYEVPKNLITLTASIYPDKVQAVVPNVGIIEVFNELGKTDPSKVNLIPISTIRSGSNVTYVKPTLNVELILKDGNKYTEIYSTIAGYLDRNDFAVGYVLTFDVNGTKLRISNELFAKFPNVQSLTGAFYLTGQQTGSVGYRNTSDGIIINLSQINTQISAFYFTQQRVLLTWWQILLIVLSIILLIVLIIVIIIVVRRKKEREYSLNEKI